MSFPEINAGLNMISAAFLCYGYILIRRREIEKHRDNQAHALAIDPTLIASKSVIGDLARDWDQHAPDLMNWQRELLQ